MQAQLMKTSQTENRCPIDEARADHEYKQNREYRSDEGKPDGECNTTQDVTQRMSNVGDRESG